MLESITTLLALLHFLDLTVSDSRLVVRLQTMLPTSASRSIGFKNLNAEARLQELGFT